MAEASVQTCVYVLCGFGRKWGLRLKLPCHGAFVVPEHDVDGAPLHPMIGLPFGVGSPEIARFAPGKDWIVVRVAANDAVPLYDDWLPATLSAVRFRRGFVIYCGERRGALETLIQCGADRQAMTVQLALPDANGISRAGPWGMAIGGDQGYAQSGEHGIAIAGYLGVARSGALGRAEVEGSRGLAVVDTGGTATTAGDGISVVRGRGGHAESGWGGIAVGMKDVDSLRTLEYGIAVARGDAGLVLTGPSSIAVVADTPGTGRGVEIRVGAGTLVVCRSTGDEHATCIVAVAGRRGFKADTPYVLIDGQFCEADTSPARTFPPAVPTEDAGASVLVEGGSTAATPFAVQPGQPWWEAAAAASPDAEIVQTTHGPGSTIVLRRTSYHWTGPVEVQNLSHDAPDESPWDPDPKSFKGLFGLAWGRGDASRLEIGQYWTLTIVERPIEVPTTDGGCVKFERGEIIYGGPLPGAIAGLLAMGVDPKSLAFETMNVGATAVARVGSYGVAIAGDHGWAIAGDHAEAGRWGYAEALHGDGKAMAGPNGITQVSAEGGSAISSGEDGISVSFSKYATVSAAGLAVATNKYVEVRTSGGIAIGGLGSVRACSGPDGRIGIAIGSDNVVTSQDGIAIARDRRAKVRGEMGALLVLRSDTDQDDWISAVVGKDGIEPYKEYSAHGGAFVPTATVQPETFFDLDKPE